MKSVITVADIAAVFVVATNWTEFQEDHKNRIDCTLRLLEAIFMAILVLD